MKTPEQRVVEILKDRLPIDMHHYQYQELAAEILNVNTTEDEPCPLCKEAILYTPNQIALRKIDEYWIIHHSDVPLTRSKYMIEFVYWLHEED